jgi:hypothetical protein
VETSLTLTVRCIDADATVYILLYCTEADLDQWVNQRLQIALLTSVSRLHPRIARSCKDDSPKVNAVDILPIVDLFVRLLKDKKLP